MILNEHEEEKWVNYSKDESYLIRYCSKQTIDKYSDEDGDLKNSEEFIDYMIKDCRGIYQRKYGQLQEVKCTKDLKVKLFDKYQDRFSFCLAKAISYHTFFDIEKHLKN